MSITAVLLWIVLPLNLWLLFGCAVLFWAIDRTVVASPESLMQSLVWMICWPVLLIMALRTLLLESSTSRKRGIA